MECRELVFIKPKLAGKWFLPAALRRGQPVKSDSETEHMSHHLSSNNHNTIKQRGRTIEYTLLFII